MVEWGGNREPAAPALLAPGRDPLSYERLGELVAGTAGGLRGHGLGPRSRVALLVENGPEAATAFLSIAQGAAVAPLNPAYREAELAFSLEDIGAEALVIGATLDSPARAVAAGRGIQIFELHVDPSEPAGVFRLEGIEPSTAGETGPAPDDVALLLHTSGTTSRPKLVPLTHGRLSASARNVAETLHLDGSDRCLNVMPLFHIHGLVAALLASLSAGASVACTPGFHQLRFFDWLDELAPTWYTAVPTMHAAVLARAGEHSATVERSRLRLIRSSSASLPVPVLEGLENAFGVPVIEAYGMTEAAHQMASNPLPPDVRKPGSVGRATGLEIAILDQAGTALTTGEVGEVAIRGPSVFGGYEANPEANEAAFTDRWFRTGDEGSLDEDGYLTLRGRIKEIINRGGEKISPLEIDGALLRHGAVEQAVTFPIADPLLGEEVAAAVVLAPGVHADERELQGFVAEQLAPFKVPRRIVLVDEIPKGPTGKIQRIGLAERLDAAPATREDHARPPYGFLEADLVLIWKDVLGQRDVSATDDFFALGGDSILGAEAVARVRSLVGDPDLPLASIVRAPTPAAMALEVFDHVGSGSWGAIPLRSSGARTPLFLVHPGDGDVLAYAVLARRLGPDQPTYALRARGVDDGEQPHSSLVEMATDYVAAVRLVQPCGPYVLGGFCMGAPVAVEMAVQLEAAGEEVAMLVLLDPQFRQPDGLRYRKWRARRDLGVARRRAGEDIGRAWHRARERQLVQAAVRRLRAKLAKREGEPGLPETLIRIREEYSVDPFDIPATVVVSDEFRRELLPTRYVKAVVRRPWRWTRLPCAHRRLLLPPNVDAVAAEIDAAIDAATRSSAAA
jgi:oxalate---CoA ligase